MAYYKWLSEDYLCHYGVLGMKWEKRRYYNDDGSLTSKGVIRQEKKRNRSDTINRATTPSMKGGKDKPPISPSEKISKEVGNAADHANNLVGAISNIRQTRSKKQDITSFMSDKDLQTAINRMRLEQQYSDLSAAKISKGSSYVKDTLSTIGSVAGIATSSLAIISAIKTIKGD